MTCVCGQKPTRVDIPQLDDASSVAANKDFAIH